MPSPGTPGEVFRFLGDGVELAGERWAGAPGGQEVVLLHGGGQTRHSWKRTAERLADHGYNATVLDARGHGQSGWHPGGDYSLDAFARDLLAYVATLQHPPVLVGASLGGMTSLIAAGEHPGLARALVLVDIVVRSEPAGVRRIMAFMGAHPHGFGSLEEVADAIAAYNPNRPRPESLDGLRKNVRRRDDGRWYWHWDPAFMQIDDEPRRLVEPERLSRAAAELRIPVLIVRGHRSDVVTDDALADTLALIPHAQVAEVAAAGHMVAGDDNDVFASRLETFLESL